MYLKNMRKSIFKSVDAINNNTNAKWFVFHISVNMDLIQHNYRQLPYLRYWIYWALGNQLSRSQVDYYKIYLLPEGMAVSQSFRGK